jgi:hypothetical protein
MNIEITQKFMSMKLEHKNYPVQVIKIAAR